MKNRLLPLLFLLIVQLSVFSQAYIKLEVDRGDTLVDCDNTIKSVPIGMADGPKMITWWDNSWQPSSGFKAEDICVNKQITHGIVDTNCTHLESMIAILHDTIPQIYLDTIIAVMPSTPSSCDGSLSFVISNINVGDTRTFGSSSSGGVTSSTVFSGLCADYYNYGVHLNGGAILQVRVSLNFPPITPCQPFVDSLVLIDQSGPGNCDASVIYNSEFLDGTTTLFHHSIIQPVGSGSVVINSDSLPSYTGLCAGPYLIRTEDQVNNNQYFTNNAIFIDEPLLNDSVWGSPSSPQGDTILLHALTNCGINYTFNVDDVYISDMTYVGGTQFEFEIAVIQQNDTLYSYETANADTSKQLCFDLTFFCADSMGFGTSQRTTPLNQLHSYIYFDASDGFPTGVKHGVKVLADNIKVYPVPTSDFLEISNLPEGLNTIRIIGIDGRTYHAFSSNSEELRLDVRNYSNGLYILSVLNEERGIHFFKKLIIN